MGRNSGGYGGAMPQQSYGSFIPSLRSGNGVTKRPFFSLPRRAGECLSGSRSGALPTPTAARNPLELLVAGTGFEPVTFGLSQRYR